MDIINLRLSTFKKILRDKLDRARDRRSADFRHLKITYSWARYETDEDVFEHLKFGHGGKYIESIVKENKHEQNINDKTKD
jgi:hypothetical protein